MVELTALCLEEVSRVSACVPLTLGIILELAPVGSAGRLNVIPGSLILVDVALTLPDKPVVTVTDGCIGEDHVELIPIPSLDDEMSVSLAGTPVLDGFKDSVVGIVLDVWAPVPLTAASVTVLSSEKEMVLRSSAFDLELEMYTVEKVAVTMPEVIGVLGCVYVPFDTAVESGGIATELVAVDNPKEVEPEDPDNVRVEV